MAETGFSGPNLQEAYTRGYPHACWWICYHCFFRKTVAKAMPVSGVNGRESASATTQVLVQRCQVGARMLTSACRPHEEAKGTFEVLPLDFFGLCQFFELVLEFEEFAGD